MIISTRVTTDKRGFLIAPMFDLGGRKRSARGKSFPNPMYDKFKAFTNEYLNSIEYGGDLCQMGKGTKSAMFEYVTDRYIETHDDIIDDIPTADELSEMFEKYKKSVSKRILRLTRKALLNNFNWWVTFTYDDDKVTEAEFEKKLRCALSDFSSHRGWRYIMVSERGKKTDRKHFHALIKIPDGQEVGAFFNRSQRSSKRFGKWEQINDNSYFNERFGNSDWQKLNNQTLDTKVVKYLSKYICKQTDKIIYSRGLVDEIELEYDTDNYENTFSQHIRHGCFVYRMVDKRIFMSEEELEERYKDAIVLPELDEEIEERLYNEFMYNRYVKVFSWQTTA